MRVWARGRRTAPGTAPGTWWAASACAALRAPPRCYAWRTYSARALRRGGAPTPESISQLLPALLCTFNYSIDTLGPESQSIHALYHVNPMFPALCTVVYPDTQTLHNFTPDPKHLPSNPVPNPVHTS
jgi:hypothetical protein